MVVLHSAPSWKLSDCVTLYSPAVILNIMDMVTFLDWVSNLLQSKGELCFGRTFCLAIVTIKVIGGRVCRILQSNLYPKITDKIIDQSNSDNLCVAGSLAVLAASRDLTDTE